MKKITIGRGRECDIRLDDSTDMVSRRQAVITVTPFGKMTIYDTSSNGTYVNGEKVEKPKGTPVKRGDQINFAHVADLDWDQVKDPYRPMKITTLMVLFVVVVTAVLFFIFADKFTQTEIDDTGQTEEVKDTVQEEPLKLQIPKETPTPKAPSNSGRSKTQNPPAKPNANEVKDNNKPATDALKGNQKVNDALKGTTNQPENPRDPKADDMKKLK